MIGVSRRPAPGPARGKSNEDAYGTEPCSGAGDSGGPTLVLLRVAGTPIGRVDLPGSTVAASGVALARAITRAHADSALRVALAAWIRPSSNRSPFRVEDAFDAAREAAMPSRPSSGPSITVAICSRDRPWQLARALGAIAPMLQRNDELLVVLNAPANDAPSPAREHGPDVRFVVEPRPGLDWARNRALIEFRSDVILFTDDDCVPDAGWIDAHRSLFGQNPDVGVATGLVEPLELATPAQVLFERYGGFARGYLRRWIQAPRRRSVAGAVGNVGEYGAGANLAIRRRLIELVGPFDAALGAGTATSGGDELEFLFRTLKSGGLLASEPRAIVRHEHRRDVLELETQIEGWSRGYSCAIERSTLAFPEERVAYRMLRARIALLYHARRALLRPNLRRLAIAELRGMRGAARLYAHARTNAEEIAARIPSPAPDASPVGPRSSSTAPRQEAGRAARVTVDLSAMDKPLSVGEGVADVSVSVLRSGRPLGVVVLPVCHGAVGVDRLRDAVIDYLGDALVGGDWGDAVRATHRQLADAALARRPSR